MERQRFAGQFCDQRFERVARGVDELVHARLHANHDGFFTQNVADVHAPVLVAAHGMADGDQLAQAVLDAQRRGDRRGQQVAAADRLLVKAAPLGVLLRGRDPVDLHQLALPADLRDDAVVLRLAVGAGEQVGHLRAAPEERRHAAVRKTFAVRVQQPLALDGVVRGAAAEKGLSPDDLLDALQILFLLRGGGGHIEIVWRVRPSGGLQCRLRDRLSPADAAAVLGLRGDADRQVGIGKGEEADEGLVAPDVALRGDDPGKAGVAEHRDARQLRGDRGKQGGNVVITACICKRGLQVRCPDRGGRLFSGKPRIRIGACTDISLEHRENSFLCTRHSSKTGAGSSLPHYCTNIPTLQYFL